MSQRPVSYPRRAKEGLEEEYLRRPMMLAGSSMHQVGALQTVTYQTILDITGKWGVDAGYNNDDPVGSLQRRQSNAKSPIHTHSLMTMAGGGWGNEISEIWNGMYNKPQGG
jgi:hypothetical protein